MKKLFILSILILFFISINSCSLQHMQTPRTVPVGDYSGGIGILGTTSEGNAFALPGLWVRTGLTPNFDVGIQTFGLGMKLDGKYSLNDYLAIGAGGGAMFLGALIYNIEGSLYAGIPLGQIYPYGVARINQIGITASVEDTLVGLHGTGVSTVGGTKLKFGPSFSIYLEGGAWFPISDDDDDPIPLFGAGFTIGH